MRIAQLEQVVPVFLVKSRHWRQEKDDLPVFDGRDGGREVVEMIMHDGRNMTASFGDGALFSERGGGWRERVCGGLLVLFTSGGGGGGRRGEEKEECADCEEAC